MTARFLALVLASVAMLALSSPPASAACVWDGRTWLCDGFRYQYWNRDRDDGNHWRWREHRREERLEHEHYREGR
jgi:hypothetical protein